MSKRWKKRTDHYNRHKPMKRRRYSIRNWHASQGHAELFGTPLGSPERFFDSIKEAESVGLWLARKSKWAYHVLYDEFEKRVIRIFDPTNEVPAKNRYDWMGNKY